ncbi:hypothetical protein [Amycolatopsis alkalitolerans]|uniref:Uncharacterized protein n=1 Tax=Amycolatopsis alkalitolerans TaxID=2547244 RepID=A0A5C4LTI5_9PSEU|nr:hypothetical protein [Amycolatopsis alkalitolerans]TNC20579.1 hypothetical protein FG385_30635 [Amycolatopsis alkalitolerans]
MSMSADAATVPSPTETVVFEPRCDRPAAEDPWIGPAVRGQGRCVRTRLGWSVLILAACIYVLVGFSSRTGIALPAVPAIVCALRLWVCVRVRLRYGSKARHRLLQGPFRKISLTVDDLLTLRSAAYLRLAPDQWLKIAPASVYGPLFARKPYVWMPGPDPVGRVIVVAPGIVSPVVGRVTQAPPPSAEPLEPFAPLRDAPSDDEVLRSFIRYSWRVLIRGALVNLAFVGWLLATYLPPLFRDESKADNVLGAATLWGLVLAACALCTNARALLRLARMSRAAAAAVWTPLPVTFDRAVRQGARAQELTGRLHLPDGQTRSVEFRHVGSSVAAAMRISGVLWIAGEPGKGYRPVGLPGHPTLALAKVGRARRPRQ